MCGIVGIYNIDDAIAIASNILVNQENRGTDSTGVGYITKNGIEVQKKAVPPRQFADLVENKKEVKILIGHNRNATTNVGEKDKDREAHPFVSENKDFCLVHNGHVLYHESMRNFLELTGHKFSSGGVDSEVLVHMLEELLKRYSREESMERFFHLLEGENVLVLFKDKELYGYPANSYFKIIKIDNGIIIASEFDSFREVLKAADTEEVVGYYPDTTRDNHMIKVNLDENNKVCLSLFGDWEEDVFKYKDWIVHNRIMCDYCRETKLTERFNNHDRCLECYKQGKDKTMIEVESTTNKVNTGYPYYSYYDEQEKVDLKKIWGKCEQCQNWFTLDRMIYCHHCDRVLCDGCYNNKDVHLCNVPPLTYID